jgi:hypothetical protein
MINRADLPSDVERLLLKKHLETIEHVFDGPWVTLYRSEKSDRSSATFYSALVDPSVVEQILQTRSWEIMIGSTGIGYSTSGETAEYSRESRPGVEAFLVPRSFCSPQDSRFEICEEFRLFHALKENWATGKWFKADEDGENILVAEIGPDLIRVMKAPLLSFLRAKQMNLVVYFECDECLEGTKNPIPEAQREEDVATADRRWGRHTALIFDHILSRLMGKILLAPPPFPTAQQVHDEIFGRQKCEEFIIGYDDQGLPKAFTSNPDQLANFFGANPEAPQYLTPIHFDRRVLDRYYNDPDRFEVRDGELSCKHHWSMRIDNDIHDRVIVYLGDLGRDLPQKHQLHWKSFNLPPESSMSRTAYKRGMLAQPTDAEAPDHVFKTRFRRFQKGWQAKFGWDLFLPVAASDDDLMKRLRIPAADSIAEFDAQILILTKILNDSINVKTIRNVAGSGSEKEGSIALLGRYLSLSNYEHAKRAETLLRDLQTVRSTGAAHRKGKNYGKAIERLEVDKFGRKNAILLLLKDLSDMMKSIQDHFVGCDPTD